MFNHLERSMTRIKLREDLETIDKFDLFEELRENISKEDIIEELLNRVKHYDLLKFINDNK